jgi:hypothetical protein
MLMQALTQRLWESRYLWEWIVLECLFGPESPQETTFRLSQRIAFFTGTDASEREKIFSSAKDAYKWRSKIVHGGRISRLTSEKSLDLVSFSEGVIRSSMVRILNESQVCSALNGSGREAFLESLVFAGGVLAVDRGYTGSPT